MVKLPLLYYVSRFISLRSLISEPTIELKRTKGKDKFKEFNCFNEQLNYNNKFVSCNELIGGGESIQFLQVGDGHVQGVRALNRMGSGVLLGNTRFPLGVLSHQSFP